MNPHGFDIWMGVILYELTNPRPFDNVNPVIKSWVVAHANLPSRARWIAKADVDQLVRSVESTKRESDDPPNIRGVFHLWLRSFFLFCS